jgi:hypothetical protein
MSEEGTVFMRILPSITIELSSNRFSVVGAMYSRRGQIAEFRKLKGAIEDFYKDIKDGFSWEPEWLAPVSENELFFLRWKEGK